MALFAHAYGILKGAFMADVSVIILTFDEEKNLPDCLDSVKGWAKEVFVVDSYSTDKTVEIALSRAKDGVRVVQHAFHDYSTQWNWALSRLPLKGAWTLKLDGDERLTEEFRREADAFLPTAPPEIEGVYFPRRIFFLGQELKWGGIKKNHDLRMWRTGKALFEDKAVNEHAMVKGGKVKFKAPVDHKDNKDLAHWIEKHNRYTSLEAIAQLQDNMTGDVTPQLFGQPEERRKWLQVFYWNMPFRSILLFVYLYFFRLGFLDGRVGFHKIFLRIGFIHLLADLKAKEALRTGVLPEVAWPERGKPHPAVARSALQKQVDRAQRPRRGGAR
jgi:glycosyltransferase involved in cell wall biosynthesis